MSMNQLHSQPGVLQADQKIWRCRDARGSSGEEEFTPSAAKAARNDRNGASQTGSSEDESRNDRSTRNSYNPRRNPGRLARSKLLSYVETDPDESTVEKRSTYTSAGDGDSVKKKLLQNCVRWSSVSQSATGELDKNERFREETRNFGPVCRHGEMYEAELRRELELLDTGNGNGTGEDEVTDVTQFGDSHFTTSWTSQGNSRQSFTPQKTDITSEFEFEKFGELYVGADSRGNSVKQREPFSGGDQVRGGERRIQNDEDPCGDSSLPSNRSSRTSEPRQDMQQPGQYDTVEKQSGCKVKPERSKKHLDTEKSDERVVLPVGE